MKEKLKRLNIPDEVIELLFIAKRDGINIVYDPLTQDEISQLKAIINESPIEFNAFSLKKVNREGGIVLKYTPHLNDTIRPYEDTRRDALNALSQGNTDLALELYHDLVGIYFPPSYVYSTLGFLYWKKGNISLAIDYFLLTISKDPTKRFYFNVINYLEKYHVPKGIILNDEETCLLDKKILQDKGLPLELIDYLIQAREDGVKIIEGDSKTLKEIHKIINTLEIFNAFFINENKLVLKYSPYKNLTLPLKLMFEFASQAYIKSDYITAKKILREILCIRNPLPSIYEKLGLISWKMYDARLAKDYLEIAQALSPTKCNHEKLVNQINKMLTLAYEDDIGISNLDEILQLLSNGTSIDDISNLSEEEKLLVLIAQARRYFTVGYQEEGLKILNSVAASKYKTARVNIELFKSKEIKRYYQNGYNQKNK